ncbi:VOC family protein [Vibrio europaeus]|uniref:VOC family protein n=1 Tax=Vibrio europaeus TaxID=300876 RepID=UPI0039DFEC81
MTSQLQQAALLPSQMQQGLPEFISQIMTLADKLGLELSKYQADHIAMRINEPGLAMQAHQEWQAYGQVISQAQINGRPIVVIAFDTPLESHGWSFECLELPYPAQGKIYPKQGWEHVEFVVPSTAQTAEEYLADLKQQFPDFAAQWERLSELGIKTKLSSPKGEGERLNNPTVAFKWQGVCIKLHPHSLKKIVESEQAA